jgi:putative ABC transport system ATP-binding protein
MSVLHTPRRFSQRRTPALHVGGGHGQVLELVDIAKHYPGTPPIKALDGVSLSVTRGELVAIVGASGSGKSTLMNIIGTLDRSTAGHAFLDGNPVADLSDAALAGLRAARIGFVFQQFHLLEGTTAAANVANGLLYQGVAPKQRRRLAIDALERVGLGHRTNHKASKLSGGERQRVAIARAIVANPAIVLADEPTGNLDSATSSAIVELLRDLNNDGTTIVVITHDQDLAATMPRRVTLRDGRIIDDSSARSRTP